MMTRTLFLLVPLLVWLPATATTESPEPSTVWSKPAHVEFGNGEQRRYEEGLIFVRENRNEPDSGIIGVRFIRFQSVARQAGPPVFYLPGGPGSTVDPEELTRPRIQATIELYTQAGDLVFLDQRGNGNVDFHPDMRVHIAEQPLDQPANTDIARRALRRGTEQALEKWRAAGVDVSAYDIRHAVDDLDAARQALGYERIMLRGNSFGSQWSFSYMRTHPEHVARAVLGGIEPIDFGYDMPSHVWQAMQRIGERAATDPRLASHFEDKSLADMIREVLERLEGKPVSVKVQHPDGKDSVEIMLGAEDLRASLMRFAPDYYMRSGLARWPKFIVELHQGDYRYLGLLRLQARRSRTLPLVFLTIDNSLGISPSREQAIRNDPATEVLGNINATYFWTRDMMPVDQVDPTFREYFDIDTPVLMFQGDLDMNTPIENAEHVKQFMPNGHLLRVEGGTHLAIYEAMQFVPEVRQRLLEFLQSGSNDGMPERIELDSPQFEVPGQGPTLYEQALTR